MEDARDLDIGFVEKIFDRAEGFDCGFECLFEWLDQEADAFVGETAGDEDFCAFDVGDAAFDGDVAEEQEFGEREGAVFLEIDGGEVGEDYPGGDFFVA